MQTDERKVDWEQTKKCLALVDKSSKEFLRQALLIGGAACMFYRNQLFKVKDPDFPVLPVKGQDTWLSRDIDFTGIFSQDALKLLPNNIRDFDGQKFIVIDGVRFGFAQAGVTFDPAEAFENAWVGMIKANGEQVEFLVIDPVTLYFEKCKLCAQRGSKHDLLHKQVLFDFIAYKLVNGAEMLLKDSKLPITESKNILQLWKQTKSKTPEILQDGRLLNRLNPILADKPDHLFAKYLKEAQNH